MHRQKRDGKVVYVDDSAGDALTNPEYSCEVVPVHGSEGNVVGQGVLHWMAFKKEYGPESQAQIDWHVNRGYPGAETWQVGVPVA